MNSGGGGAWDRVLFQIGEICYHADGWQPIDEVHFKDGAETSRASAYVRGKVCLAPAGPCPPDIEFCHGLGCGTVWCDGEPPEPFECDW